MTAVSSSASPRTSRWAAVVTIILVVAGAGALSVRWATKVKIPANLKLGTVERGDIVQRVTIAGTVKPARRTLVMAPFEGYIKKLYVKTGDRVRAGDPIVSVVQSLAGGDEIFPLRAPFSGTVVQTLRAEGEYVRGQNPDDVIVRIDDLSKLYIDAKAPEIDRTKLILGQETTVKASAIIGRTYKGVVREIALAATEGDRYSSREAVDYPVRIEIIDPDEQIRPGMSTVIDITTGKKNDVLRLRHEFINRDDNRYFVFLADGTKREIKVGIQNEEAFEILSGATKGAQVRQVDFLSLSEKEK